MLPVMDLLMVINFIRSVLLLSGGRGSLGEWHPRSVEILLEIGDPHGDVDARASSISFRQHLS